MNKNGRWRTTSIPWLAVVAVLSAKCVFGQSLSRSSRDLLAGEAESLFAAKDYAAAREKWATALAGSPSRAEARRWRPEIARCLEAEGNYQKALTAYQEAYDIDPKNVDRVVDLARLYDVVGMDDEASRFYGLAHARDPRRRDVALALGRLDLDAGRLKEAQALVESAVKAEPRDGSSQELLAAIEERQGDLLAAAQRLETVFALRPTLEGWKALGRLWARQDAFEQADRAFVRAAQLGPLGPEILFERAVLAWRQNERDRALDLLKEAEALSPGYFPAVFVRSLMAREARDRAGQRAARLTSQDPAAMKWIKWAGDFHE